MFRPLVLIVSLLLAVPAVGMAADEEHAAPTVALGSPAPRGPSVGHPWTVRFELGFGDGDMEAEYDFDGGTSLDQKYDDSIAFEYSARLDRHFGRGQRWGWHLGAGYVLRAVNGAFGEHNDEDDVVMRGALVAGGLVYRPADWLRCDFGLRLHAGIAEGRFEHQSGGWMVDSENGAFVGLGLSAGVYAEYRRFEYGFVATYTASAAQVEFADVTLTRDGVEAWTGDMDVSYAHHGATFLLNLGVNLGPDAVGSSDGGAADANPWSARLEYAFGPGVDRSVYAFANAPDESRRWNEPWARHYALLLGYRFHLDEKWGLHLGGGLYRHDAFGDNHPSADDDYDTVLDTGAILLGGGFYRPCEWLRLQLDVRTYRGKSEIEIHDENNAEKLISDDGDHDAVAIVSAVYATWHHAEFGVLAGYLTGESTATFEAADYRRNGEQFVTGDMSATCHQEGAHIGMTIGVAW